MKAAFVHSHDVDQYSYGEAIRFVAGRAGQALDLCRQRDLLLPPSDHVVPRPATRQEVSKFHTDRYLDLLREAESGKVSQAWLAHGLGSLETPVFKGLWDYSMLVAGGSLKAARLVADGHFDRAFHPAGGLHHAHPESAGGFCYINDVVLAVMELRDRGMRVAVVDIDAHHGDGTQAAFYSDPNVLTVSVHESGETLYPWGGAADEIGEGDGEGRNVNIPLPKGAHDEVFLRVIDEVVVPFVRDFGPDVLVTEVSGDPLWLDPLTHLGLTNNAIVEAMERLDAFDLPWVVVGGGGYAVKPTVQVFALAWSVISRTELTDPFAGLIGGMMAGLSEVEEGDLRDRPRYVPPETREQVEKKLNPVIELHRSRLGKG